MTHRNILVYHNDKPEPRKGVYSIDCKTCEPKYIGEMKWKLAVRVKEHTDGVEQITWSRVYTRDSRKQSEGG